MIDRRSFLRSGFLGSIGALAFGKTSFAATSDSDIATPKQRALRIAHITDCHTQPTIKTEKALKTVVKQISNMVDRPDFIVNTGDTVLEANYTEATYVDNCWHVWQEAITYASLPIYSCIGNHDIWISKDIQEHQRKFEGKKWALNNLGLTDRYYSFEENGWKFIALDSNNEKDYSLDDDQFAWLHREISSTDNPVCIFSHVPIISAAALMYELERKNMTRVGFPKRDQHSDVKKLKDLFFQNKNVKLCLSGHVHYIDEVEYLGVKYMCNGSVAGNWWQGKLDEFPPAYAIIDLYTDGTVQKKLIYY